MQWLRLPVVAKHGMPVKQQKLPLVHPASPAQVVAHPEPLQTYGAQLDVVIAGHAPPAAQLAATVSVEPLHDWLRQTTLSSTSHAVGEVPLHVAWQLPDPKQAPRAPCG